MPLEAAHPSPSAVEAAIDRFVGRGFRVSFPYNHDPALWEAIAPYARAVEEIYAELHPSLFPSMRPWVGLPSAPEHLARLARLARTAAPRGMALNLVLNLCPTGWVRSAPLFDAIAELRRAGLIRVTIADFEWAGRLRAAFPDLPIGVSTVVEVDGQLAAMPWREVIGVDTVTVGRRINKDPRRIAEIRRLGVRIKMVVSDTCTDDCPLRPRHFALLAADGSHEERARVEAELLMACAELKARTPVWHLVKKTVLPFHLPRYAGLVDLVKLNDRRRSTESNVANLVRYLEMTENTHPLFNYREPDEAFDKLATCRRDCAECAWCAEHVVPLGPRTDLPRPEEIRAARAR